MRNIILWMSVSTDGFFEGTNRDLDWHGVDEQLLNHFNYELRQMSAFLEGRVTYELMAEYWPTADSDPWALQQASKRGLLRPITEFAGIWRDMPKYVFSRTMERAGWNTTVIRDVVPAEIENLKAQPGGDMVLGGANLAASFMQHDLIDEYRLFIHPVALGQGKLLFQSPHAKLNFGLEETRAFNNGVVLLRYRRPTYSRGFGRV